VGHGEDFYTHSNLGQFYTFVFTCDFNFFIFRHTPQITIESL